MRVRLGLAGLILCGLGATSHAADGSVYICITQKFTSQTLDDYHDVAFEQKNLSKRYKIFESEKKFTVVTFSDEFRDSAEDYLIVTRGLLGSYAIAESTVSMDTLAIDNSPAAQARGFSNSTLTRQGTRDVNTWFLACKPDA